VNQDALASARFAIRELIERYSDAINRRDFTSLAGLFIPESHWWADAPHNLHFEGAAIAPAIAQMVETFPFLLQMTCSIVVNVDGNGAEASTTIREMAQAADATTGLDSLGLYHDVLARTPNGWRFASRRFQPLYLETAPLRGQVLPGQG